MTLKKKKRNFEDEGRMRGGRWIYHRQVAAPLELWIMYSSSIPRKREIEFTLTSEYSHVYLSCTVRVPLCKPAIRRDQHQSSIKKKTDGFFKDMFSKYFFFPSSLHHKCKDELTHVHPQTFTPEIRSDRHFIVHTLQLDELGWWKMQQLQYVCSFFQ